MTKKTISVIFDGDQLRDVEAAAQRNGLSLSAYIRMTVLREASTEIDEARP